MASEDLKGGLTTSLGYLFQFVPTVSCPVTEHYWKELVSVFFAPYIQSYMDSDEIFFWTFSFLDSKVPALNFLHI